jgi:guanylate kinase
VRPPQADPPFDDRLWPEEYLPKPPSLLFILSGPSGVGKDSVISRLKQCHLALHFAVTITTRPRRAGEADGVNYHFVSAAEFQELERRGALLESAVVHGNHYGTPLEQVRAALRSGKDVLLKIDVQGAAKVKQRVPQAVFIFLAPPSVAELVQRLESRGTESPEEQVRRLRDAYEEMRHLPEYDYVVVNRAGRLEETVERIKCIMQAEKSRVKPRQIAL